MPQIGVVEEGAGLTETGGPVIGGVTFPRPRTRTEQRQALRQVVELGGGETRTYDKGVRPEWSFTWGGLTGDQLEQLRVTTRRPYVTLELEPGSVPVVVSTEDGVTADAVAGTFPIRYTASLTLRARKPVR